MGAHGKVRFLLLCTIYSLRLLSYDNIAMASTIPSGKLDFVVPLTKIEKEYGVYSCSYQVMSMWFLYLYSSKSRLIIIPTRLPNRLPAVQCRQRTAFCFTTRHFLSMVDERVTWGSIFFHCFDSSKKSRKSHLENIFTKFLKLFYRNPS